MKARNLTSGFGWGLVLGFGLLAAAALLWPKVGSAVPDGGVGRYQISSWASYTGERVHHSGYYIIDTTTGKVVDRGHEIHGIDSGPRR
jgi:hypothetical protein